MYGSFLALKEELIYDKADAIDKEQFNTAIERINTVIGSERKCFSELLVYVAGMMCFSCNEEWGRYVDIREHVVLRLRISSKVCSDLWSQCSDYSQRTVDMTQAIRDSRLSSFVVLPIENLDMFKDREELCDWAHDIIAMRPFVTPSEHQREQAGIPLVIGRRLEESTSLDHRIERGDVSFLTERLLEEEKTDVKKGDKNVTDSIGKHNNSTDSLKVNITKNGTDNQITTTSTTTVPLFNTENGVMGHLNLEQDLALPGYDCLAVGRESSFDMLYTGLSVLQEQESDNPQFNHILPLFRNGGIYSLTQIVTWMCIITIL